MGTGRNPAKICIPPWDQPPRLRDHYRDKPSKGFDFFMEKKASKIIRYVLKGEKDKTLEVYARAIGRAKFDSSAYCYAAGLNLYSENDETSVELAEQILKDADCSEQELVDWKANVYRAKCLWEGDDDDTARAMGDYIINQLEEHGVFPSEIAINLDEAKDKPDPPKVLNDYISGGKLGKRECPSNAMVWRHLSWWDDEQKKEALVAAKLDLTNNPEQNTT
ncbi:hypothetical protein B0J11DRAFT_582776 [Dendryphion nanum]|uniref:Uncharacterized protein n=1 Tax=Dendryphion nanum TaxID=256645 RepID=A0A9P9IGC5_9PLEO|nr:hypothetical protein B0J11DRAFT_582776 [Dendryphion nanum]